MAIGKIDVSGFEPRSSFTDTEEPFTFLDADTIRNSEGELFRVQGFSAPEVLHQTEAGLKAAGPGGWEMTNQIDKLAKEMGFTNVHRLTNPDGSPMMDATGTRQMVRITDKNGKDFVEALTSYGINKLSRWSSQDEIDAYQFSKLQKTQTPFGHSGEIKELNKFEKAKRIIDDVAESETYGASQFKKIALDEQELAQLRAPRQPGESLQNYALRLERAAQYATSMVSTRHLDRTLQNKALHPWAESWDIGWTGVIEGLYGAAQMVGEKTGVDWIETLGDEGVKRQHKYLQGKPELKLNILKPVLDNQGNVVGNDWDVEGMGDFFRYIGNMGAIALPYMAVTAGAGVLSPLTGGTSLAAATGIGALNLAGASMTIPVAMYAGQTWNEMEGEDRSASLAVAAGATMAALDRLGILGLMGGIKGVSLLSKESREKAVQAWVGKYKGGVRNITNDTEAKAAIAKMTRLEAGKLVGAATNIAKDQLKYGNILKSFAARSARGFGVESTTEVGQELTGYMASVIGSDKPFDSVELHNRLINAFVAGGALGAGFAVPGSAYDVGQWKDAEVKLSQANDAMLSDEGKYAEEEVRNSPNGIPRSTYDISDQYRKRAKNRVYLPEDIDFHKRAEIYDASEKQKDLWTRSKEALQSIPKLYRGHTRWTFGKDLSNPHIRSGSQLYNGTLHKINPGEAFEEYKQLQAAEFRSQMKTPAEISKDARYSTINQPKLSEVIYAFGQWLKEDPISEVDWDNLPPPEATQGVDLNEHKDWLRDLLVSTNRLGENLWNEQKKTREQFNDGTSTGMEFKVGKIKNYLLTYKSINKAAIEKNKNGFIQALMKETFSDGKPGFGSYKKHGRDGKARQINKGLTLAQATKLTNEILNNVDMIDQRSVFEIGKGRHIPAAHKNRSLKLATNKDFNEFMEKDFFVNVNNSIKSATRYMAYQKYVGDNMEIPNQMLDDAIAAGLPEERANYIAASLRDYFQAESGNYKRIENQTLANLQKNLLLWTMAAGLPMATISSFPEYMMTLRALTPEQIAKTIKGSAKELANGMWDTIQNPRLQSTQARINKEARQATLQKLGFFTWDTGAAQTTGATENTYASRYLIDKYFRIIMLQQYTDWTRNIRASIADDFIMDHLNIIAEHKRDPSSVYTNEVQESEEQLRNLGLNVPKLLELANLPLFETSYRPDNIKATIDARRQADTELERMFSLAQYNFINEAIALPGTANRPLFYQNPHLALFTQFQGFISVFTANHIPRMWGDYVRRGTPAMKYNAFAIMTTMIALGFVSQYLKDLLKYGKGSPYLDRMEKIQRGVGASGMIGVAERPLNFFFPIYETSSSNAVEELFHTVSGEAAALSNVSRAATGAFQMLEGKIEPGAYKLFKTTPFIGPFNPLNRKLSEGVGNLFPN